MVAAKGRRRDGIGSGSIAGLSTTGGRTPAALGPDGDVGIEQVSDIGVFGADAQPVSMTQSTAVRCTHRSVRESMIGT
jgi:hypothetical protein